MDVLCIVVVPVQCKYYTV